MLIGNEAKVTPYPLLEANAIKKLTPNVKITFNLSSVTPDKIRSSGGCSPGAFLSQKRHNSFMNVT